jgi:hypothetical protein
LKKKSKAKRQETLKKKQRGAKVVEHNPDHRRDFEQLLDDIAPRVEGKK